MKSRVAMMQPEHVIPTPKSSTTKPTKAQAKKSTAAAHSSPQPPHFRTKRRMRTRTFPASKTKNVRSANAEKNERPWRRRSKEKSKIGKDGTISGRNTESSHSASSTTISIRTIY